MVGFLLGAGSGVLAGAAVYYSISTSIAQNTAAVRAELGSSSRVLEHSFDTVPAPAASSRIGPSYPAQASFSELLRHRWNNAIGSAVSGVRDANWSALGSAAVGAAQGAAQRIGSASAVVQEKASAAADSAAAVADPVVKDALDAKDAVAAAVGDAADKAAETVRVAQLRAQTNVDAPLQPSPKVTESPKRLV